MKRNKPVYISNLEPKRNSGNELKFWLLFLIFVIIAFVINCLCQLINTQSNNNNVNKVLIEYILPQYQNEINNQIETYLGPYKLNNLTYKKQLSDIDCIVKSKKGDEDNTPLHYFWATCKSELKIYKQKQFSQDYKLAEVREVSVGPFLIYPEKNLYAITTSSGSGWEDFYNLDKGIEWKTYK